jgi:DnaJ-class molecular chaperone
MPGSWEDPRNQPNVSIAPHKMFRRQGYDLLVDLPLTVAQAALGMSRSTSLDGGLPLKVPSGTRPGKTFRFKERHCQAANVDRESHRVGRVEVLSGLRPSSADSSSNFPNTETIKVSKKATQPHLWR